MGIPESPSRSRTALQGTLLNREDNLELLGDDALISIWRYVQLRCHAEFAGLFSGKSSIKNSQPEEGKHYAPSQIRLNATEMGKKQSSASPAAACHGLFLPNSATRESNLLPYSVMTGGQTSVSMSGIKTELRGGRGSLP